MDCFRFGFCFRSVALACLAIVLSSCKVVEPEIVTEVVERVVVIDSTTVEFIDTTLCPPNLSDTLVLVKTILKTLPPKTFIVRDTIIDTLDRKSFIDRVVTKYVDKNVTKNNWWLLVIGLIAGFYAEKNLRVKRRDM